MQKITPSLWVDTNSKGIAGFYTSIFPDSTIKNVTTLSDTPSGTVDVVSVSLWGYDFTIMAAGPLFKITPAISFTVCCDSEEQVDTIWGKLSEGGMALMELAEYPFSKKYGWIKDKYGLTWQIILISDQKIEQRIMPSLMYVGPQSGRAEEAINFYASVFKNSKMENVMRFDSTEAPEKEGTIKHARFTLEGQEFTAMDSAYDHKFNFNEAISFEVRCKDQAEIDYYWDKLSAVPEAEQCGWLKDKFGVSWQIVPQAMDEMMKQNDPEKRARVTQAFLKMKKFDIAALERAAEGKE